LAKAKIRVTPTSSESSASGVVSRIAFGEADAGIAYVTDGLIAGDKVEAIVIADLQNVLANYPIGVAAKPKSKDSAMINAFIATAKSKVGKKVFTSRGFMVS
jgi:molybdate transport system substrate-binding protein